MSNYEESNENLRSDRSRYPFWQTSSWSNVLALHLALAESDVREWPEFPELALGPVRKYKGLSLATVGECPRLYA